VALGIDLRHCGVAPEIDFDGCLAVVVKIDFRRCAKAQEIDYYHSLPETIADFEHPAVVVQRDLIPRAYIPGGWSSTKAFEVSHCRPSSAEELPMSAETEMESADWGASGGSTGVLMKMGADLPDFRTADLQNYFFQQMNPVDEANVGEIHCEVVEICSCCFLADGLRSCRRAGEALGKAGKVRVIVEWPRLGVPKCVVEL